MNSALTVYLVEDDAAVQLGCVQALQLADIPVKAFDSAEALLPHVRPGMAAVVVTDMRLPGADGLAVISEVRDVDADVPIIMITGHGNVELAVEAMRNGGGIHCKYVPGTYTPLANHTNDYLMDREKQRTGELYSGVEGIAIQDASLQESMGPIADRTREHLTGTDKGIVQTRRKLIEAALALAERGEVPPGTEPAEQRVRSVAIVLPDDQPFYEAAREALRAEPGKPHASV